MIVSINLFLHLWFRSRSGNPWHRPAHQELTHFKRRYLEKCRYNQLMDPTQFRIVSYCGSPNGIHQLVTDVYSAERNSCRSEQLEGETGKGLLYTGLVCCGPSPSAFVPGAPAALVWFYTQLDSIEPCCVCVHMTSSRTCEAHDRKQNVGKYCFYYYCAAIVSSWVNNTGLLCVNCLQTDSFEETVDFQMCCSDSTARAMHE